MRIQFGSLQIRDPVGKFAKELISTVASSKSLITSVRLIYY